METEDEDGASFRPDPAGALVVDIIAERSDLAGLDITPDTIRSLVAHTLQEEDIDAAEVSITLTDDCGIQKLNRDYRDKDKPTNVLSFPSLDAEDIDDAIDWSKAGGPPLILGDIILSTDTCTEEAAQAGKPVAHHVSHLIIHGLLHLLGYDHIDDDDADEMEALEIELLAARSIPNPYLVNPDPMDETSD